MKDDTNREPSFDATESKNQSMRGNSLRENRETLEAPPADSVGGPPEKAQPKSGGVPSRESDESVIPAKRANNAPEVVPGAAESVEERGSTKGNTEKTRLVSDTAPVKRRGMGLLGVRMAAQRDKEVRFTALLHHVTPELLRASYEDLNPKAAPGVDEVTWQEYGSDLETRLERLHEKIHRGTYRAQPSKRVWLAKADGRQRPIGIAALEDKIVQQAVRVILEQIYEEDFLGLSYGFRPGRGAHDALDALYVGIMRKKVNYVLDADIRGFFDAIGHKWMLRLLEHRIADRRILRLIQKWLTAGVSEEGEWSDTTVGTAQGAVISPLLANVYLHYVLDLWVHQWRNRHAHGDVIIVRYADDFVLGFQHRSDAEQCLRALKQRLQEFGLDLHPEKTRLIEFGRFAEQNRRKRGQRKPETFDFLGFTHYCGKRRSGSFVVKRRSIAKRMRQKLLAIKQELRRRLHDSVKQTGAWLRAVLQGWFNYHAVPYNYERINQFRTQVARLWKRALQRRSHKARRAWRWERAARLIRKWFPPTKILHPYPDERFDIRHPPKVGAV